MIKPRLRLDSQKDQEEPEVQGLPCGQRRAGGFLDPTTCTSSPSGMWNEVSACEPQQGPDPPWLSFQGPQSQVAGPPH